MKFIKKLISCVLTVSFMLSFAGCGLFAGKDAAVNYYTSGDNFFFAKWSSSAPNNVVAITAADENAVKIDFVKGGSIGTVVESRLNFASSDFLYVNFMLKASSPMQVSVTYTLSNQKLLDSVTFELDTEYQTYSILLPEAQRLESEASGKISLVPMPGASSGEGVLYIKQSFFSKILLSSSVLVGAPDTGADPDPNPDTDPDTNPDTNPDTDPEPDTEPDPDAPKPPVPSDTVYLKDLFDFPVGYAAGYRNSGGVKSGSLINYSASGGDAKYKGLDVHFNSLTAENEMKIGYLRAGSGDHAFNTGWAEEMLDYAIGQDMGMRGHALVWFNHTPAWFTRAENNSLLTKSQLMTNIQTHIEGTLERLNAAKFNNTIYAWDVVNEAIFDEYDGSVQAGGTPYRKCDLYDIAGIDYIIKSFEFADAKLKAMGIRDKVKLYYNDFNLNNITKRERTLQMIDSLLEAETPIDGIGMQGHYSVAYFNTQNFKNSLEAFLATGLDVQITELDISVYGPANAPEISLDEYNSDAGGVKTKQLNIFREIFRLIRDPKYQNTANWGKFTGLTLWGIADDYTWIDIKQGGTTVRKDYPLLFGLDGEYKIDLNEILSFREQTYYA